MAEETDDDLLSEGLGTAPLDVSLGTFGFDPYSSGFDTTITTESVREQILDPEPGFAPSGSQSSLDYDPEIARELYSPPTETLDAGTLEALNKEFQDARVEEMRLSRPGHDEEWYEREAAKAAYTKQFVNGRMAPGPPERPELDNIRSFYSEYPDALRFGLGADSRVKALYDAIDQNLEQEKIDEIYRQTKPEDYPDQMTAGVGLGDAVGRALARRVINVPYSGEKPGFENRFETRREIAREIQDILDNEGIGAAIGMAWSNGVPMAQEDAISAGLTFNDSATTKELALFSSLGASGGIAVGSKMGYLLPRAGVLGRTAGGLRGAKEGAKVGRLAGPVGMTIGALLGGAIGYGAGKVWGKVDSEEFFRPVPLFRQDSGDDGFFFAVPKGLVNLSTRAQTLMGLSDSVWVPALTNSDQESEEMRDYLAMSRPSESWNQIVDAYRSERDSGKSVQELREALRPDILQMVQSVSWNDLPSSAKHRDNLDLNTALEYAFENQEIGNVEAPRFTFEYFVGLANNRSSGPSTKALTDANMQTLLESLPLGQILKHTPEMIASDDSNGAIPSIDSFVEGVIIAAGDTDEALIATGGETSRDLGLGFAELMLKEDYDENGHLRYVENTGGKLFRVLGGLPEFYFETRLPFDLPITPASRDFRYDLGIRGTGYGYLARVLSNIATAEIGLTRHVTDEMLARGVDRQSGTYRFLATSGVLADTLVPWERPMFTAVGMPVRGAFRGARAAREFKDVPYRAKAILAAVSPSFYRFNNEVDLNTNSAIQNIRYAMGETRTVDSLKDLKARSTGDEPEITGLGFREQEVIDTVLDMVDKRGLSVDQALDSVPKGAKGDYYQVLNHLIYTQFRKAADSAEDPYSQIPMSFRGGVDDVLRAAGVDPLTARLALQKRLLQAKLVHKNATQRMLSHGTPDMQVVRASDEYKLFEQKLKDMLEETGQEAEKISVYMPLLEQIAFFEAINTSSRFKTEVEYFGSLDIRKFKPRGPRKPDPGPEVAPPDAEPAGPRPIEPDEPLPEPIEVEGATPIDGDTLPPIFEPTLIETDNWSYVEVPSIADGGYWKAKKGTSPIQSPKTTGITVYGHSNVLGRTSPAGQNLARPIRGFRLDPVAHASFGYKSPGMTLYATSEFFDARAPTIRFSIGFDSFGTLEGLPLDTVKDMYRSLVHKALFEYKIRLEENPALEFAFVDTLAKETLPYRLQTIDGKSVKVFSPMGRLKQRMSLTAKDASKFKIKKEGRGRLASFKLKDTELKKLQKQALESQTDPNVAPPSVEPEPPSVQKKKFIEQYKSFIKTDSVDPMIGAIGLSYLEVLPNQTFVNRSLSIRELISGTISVLTGSVGTKRLLKHSDLKASVDLFKSNQLVSKSNMFDGVDFTQLDTSSISELLYAKLKQYEDDLALPATGKKIYSSKSRLQENQGVREILFEIIGPVLVELNRRTKEYELAGGEDVSGFYKSLKREAFEKVSKNTSLNPDPKVDLQIGRRPILKAIKVIEDSVFSGEAFTVSAVHTLIHEMTHLLQIEVLSSNEVVTLRKAYVRERDAGFPNWRRAEQFAEQTDLEIAFMEWLADTMSDYWISGNVQRHAQFTTSEIGILRRIIRRMSRLISKALGIEGGPLTEVFPEEIIDLSQRLVKQAEDETTQLVGTTTTSIEERHNATLGKLGPADQIDSTLDRIHDQKISYSIKNERTYDYVRSISRMKPADAVQVSNEIALNSGLKPGTDEFAQTVEYLITGGREGVLSPQVREQFLSYRSESIPGPTKSTRPEFRIISQRMATEDEIAYSRRAKKKIIKKGELHSEVTVMDSIMGEQLYAMLKEGDINQLFNNEANLLRRFMTNRDFKHLIAEFSTAGTGAKARLLKEGEQKLAASWKTYIETGKAPGPLKGLFDSMYLQLQGYWLRFSPDRAIIANPKIRNWFDKWLAADLNVGPAATEVTGRVMRGFKKVRIASPKDLVKRLEEGVIARENKRREFFRIPLDTPTVRQSLGIRSNSTEIDVVEVYARAAGYVGGEYARLQSGAMKMFTMTTRTTVPLERAKTVQKAVKSRLDAVLGGDADYKSSAGFVLLNEDQAASLKVFLRMLSYEPQANIIPYYLLSDSFDLTKIKTEDFRYVQEALIDIEAGPNSVRTHYSEAIPATLAVAAWNQLKRISVGTTKHSQAMKRIVGSITDAFKEVHTMADVAPAQRAVIDSTLRQLNAIQPEFMRFALDNYKGNKDLALQQFYLSLKDTFTNPPVDIDAVTVLVGSKGKKQDITAIDYIMGREGTAEKKGSSEGLLYQLKQFRERLGTDEMEGADATRRKAMLMGQKTAESFEPSADPFGGAMPEGVPYIDFILSQRKNIEKVIRRPSATQQTFSGLSEYESWSLVTLEKYHKKLEKTRSGAIDAPLEEILTLEDFDAIEQALFYIYNSLDRRSQEISAQAMMIANGLGGGTAWKAGSFKSDLRAQGKYYQMFHRGEWLELFEDFARRFAETVGTEKYSVQLASPDVAITQIIATMRANEILKDLGKKMVQYGIAKDTTELSREFFLGASEYTSHAKVNQDLFLKRIEYYLNQDLLGRMTGFVYRQDDTLVPGFPKAPTAGRPDKPLVPRSEVLRLKKEYGAPTDFNGDVHDLEAYTKALEIIEGFGFKRKRGSFERRLLPDGTEVFLPDQVMQAIDEAIDRATGAGGSRSAVSYQAKSAVLKPPGEGDPRNLFEPTMLNKMKSRAGKATDTLFSIFPIAESKIKMGVTTGLILPNPAYFTGVFMGAGFQVFQGVGPINLGRMMANPKQTGAVVARLWKEGGFQPNAAPVIDRLTGRAYPIPEVARLAEAEGLKSSYIHAETIKTIAQDLKDIHPGFWNKMRVGRWAKNWQKTLIESATALDNYWRVSVFIDGLKRGMSPEAAAALARRTGYDYAALTKFEKTYARRTIMFYSYMRKNMDLFWDTMLTNPERITGQIRMLNGIQTAFLEDDPQVVLQDYQQSRMPVFFKNTVVNTHKYSQTMFITPPLPMMDALNFYIDMFDIAKYGDDDAVRAMATRTAPWIQAPFVMASGKDLFWDKELNEYNKVPAWLVEIDLALTGGSLVHGLFDVQYRPHRDPSKADISGESEQGWFHARNGRAWWVWRNLFQFPMAGRSMDTISYLDRANLGVVEGAVRSARAMRRLGVELGILEVVPEMRTGDTMGPRTGISRMQEALGFIGVKPVQVPTLREQVSRDLKQKQGEYKQAISRENLSTREY